MKSYKSSTTTAATVKIDQTSTSSNSGAVKINRSRSKHHAYQDLLPKSVEQDRLPLFREFAESTAPYKHVTARGRTLLIMYFVHARWLDPAMVKQLIAQPQVEINAWDEHGFTALRYAAYRKNVHHLVWLLMVEAGAVVHHLSKQN